MEWPLSEAQESLWLERLDRATTRLRRVAANRTVRLAMLLVVLPLFAAALAIAWREADIALSELAVLPIAAVVAAVPFSMLASTWQLRALTKAGGASIPWWNALRVVTLGSLSNLLPVSSGTVIRGGAVMYSGASARETGKVLVFDGAVWTSISLLYSGGAAHLAGALELAIVMVLGGAVLVPVVVALWRWLPSQKGRAELTSARSAGVLVQVVRLQACFLALGHSITFIEASTLAAASPLASIFFFLPGGLGVREAFTSAVGAAVGLSAAGAFLAAALNRLLGLTVLLLWEGVLLVWPTTGERKSVG